MKILRRRFVHLARVAAAVAVLSVTLSGHGAWSQAARTIKIVERRPTEVSAFSHWQPDAVGRHDFNPEIDVDSHLRCIGIGILR